MDRDVTALAESMDPLPFTGVDTHCEASSTRPLEPLVREYMSHVYRLLRHLGVPAGDLDDACQQVFLVLARKHSTVNPGSERAFLSSVSARIASRWRRTHRRRHEFGSEELSTQPCTHEPSPEQRLELAEAQRLLLHVLDTLPDMLREVFVLFEIEELTMRDISEVLVIPQGTVASRLRQARSQFYQIVATLKIPTPAERSR
jgi:RNA polymerase sigma-70 factor (ECF subfamily)